MRCKECGRTMLLNDYIFRGNENKYWVCEHCMTLCIEQIRYGQTLREIWNSENESVIDHIIKYKIRFR